MPRILGLGSGHHVRRLRIRKARERRALEDTIEVLRTIRPLHRRVYVLGRRVVRGLFKHHAFDHAATMAFYFFLGTIPLLVFGGVLLGELVKKTGTGALVEPLYRVIPGVTAQLIRGELETIAKMPAHSLAPLSMLGFLWLTSNGFHNLMDVFEYLAGSKPRTWWRQRAMALGWVAFALVTAVVTIGAVLLMNGFFEVVGDRAPMPVIVRRGFERVRDIWNDNGMLALVALVMTLWIAAFFRLSVTHPRTVRRRVWWGAFVAMVLLSLVTWAFAAYVDTIAHYAIFYGSLAAIAVTLLWLYLASLALLVGAEINAQLEGLRDPARAAHQ